MLLPPKRDPRPWLWAADVLLLAIFATVLIQPLYLAGYLNAWSSIESTFISDARFLGVHWPGSHTRA